MAGITVATIAGAIQRADHRMKTLEAELNAADSRLGDGDTGVMLARVIGRFADTGTGDTGDVGMALQTLARAAASATGSSLGTLFATALLAIGKASKGQEDVPWSDLPSWLETALAAMMQRGGASPGDKTVLDVLGAVAKATAGLDDPQAIAAAAVRACGETLEQFRDRPCRIGRARMFAEKSIGMDDPGMLGFARLAEALAGQD